MNNPEDYMPSQSYADQEIKSLKHGFANNQMESPKPKSSSQYRGLSSPNQDLRNSNNMIQKYADE